MRDTHPTQELYGAILQAYDFFNEKLFSDQPLPDCIITLQRQTRVKGFVSHKRWVATAEGGRRIDELAINPEYWLGWSISEVLSTLVHEQCHIWQSNYGKSGSGYRRYHNREWAAKMRDIGLRASSTSKPDGKETGTHMGDYIMLDGPFHKAMRELLASGFELPWLDSEPQGQDEPPVNIYDNEGKGYTIAGVRIEEKLPEEEIAAQRVIAQNMEEIEPRRRAARTVSSRRKYSCPSCGVNVWGKAELHLICGRCQCNFENAS